MANTLWSAIAELSTQRQVFFLVAVAIALLFEFINGFHDTANAVTTVIYTRTLKPTPAVLFSAICNFVGVLLGGTAVAFSIVNLLPVDLLIEASSQSALFMVLSLLVAGVIWNLGTWYFGLPVSSSHTLIGSILGVGLANSLLTRGDLAGVNWSKAAEVGLSLFISPIIGFVAAAGLLLLMKRFLREPKLYVPPEGDDRPPGWVRGLLISTCGAVSLAHGSNDGQKGMGLMLLVLIGFLPSFYALDVNHPGHAREVYEASLAIATTMERAGREVPDPVRDDLIQVQSVLAGIESFDEIPDSDRWAVRRSIYRLREHLKSAALPPELALTLRPQMRSLTQAIEYVPYWVILAVAIALGVGTTVGYKRIVVTVAEKIGKSHLTYAQGAAAELVAAATIGLADGLHMPVSTTQVLSSGVAGTMWANRNGVQPATIRKIALAWALTLPASILLAATFFTLSHLPSKVVEPVPVAASPPIDTSPVEGNVILVAAPGNP